ncbi:MAG: ABC transporter permease [Armatimonadetes bacterium]|nr:ABC transporter permease [Armatimonadota bacterium]
MRYLKFALRNLTQRKVRTGLTIFSIAVAVAVLFTLLSFNKGYSRALNSQLQQMGVHAMVLPIGCPYEAASLLMKGGKIDNHLPASTTQTVDRIPGIQIAAPAFMSAIMRPDEGRADVYFGIDERTFDLKNWWKIIKVKKDPRELQDNWEKLAADPANLMSRREFIETMKDPDSVILGFDASLIELSSVGDEIYVPEADRAFKVVGVLAPTGQQDDGFFFVSLKAAQQIFRKPDQITTVQIRFSDPTKANAITEELEKIPGAEVIAMGELLGTMQSLLGSARTLIFSIVFVVIAISALGVLNTVLMSVFERTREIGVMRATGAARGNVFQLVWVETLLMVGIGGAVGLGMAVAGAQVIEGVIKGAMARMDMLAGVKGSVIAFEPRIFVLCVLFILAVGVVAGIYPALKASKARPIEALRAE